MTSLPLKWHGGKQKLWRWIWEHAPEHTHRVVPYAGGLGFLLNSPLGASEVVNDLDRHLYNFWAVLRDPERFEELQRFAEATPVSSAVWEEASTYLGLCTYTEELDIHAAWALLVLVRQSRQGLRKDFCTLSKTRTRRGINEQASSWLSAVEGLSEAHDRLKGVVVLNRPAIDVIQKEDSPSTWFYLDPPYLHETRVTTEDYTHEMSYDEHLDLLDVLGQIQGKFCLSGYPSELYNEAVKLFGWRCEKREVPNHASGKKTKEKKIECLWMNY